MGEERRKREGGKDRSKKDGRGRGIGGEEWGRGGDEEEEDGEEEEGEEEDGDN